MMILFRFLCAYSNSVFIVLLILFSSSLSADNSELLKEFKKGNLIAIMRHSIAPGGGDPDNFQLNDCSTQRNLSQSGRDQSIKIGQFFRDNRIDSVEIFSSQWCRCLETARLLNIGNVSELPIINSFFRLYEREKQQTSDLQQWLVKREGNRPTLLVTHQVNITSLSGIFPNQGEIVFVKVDSNNNIINKGRLTINE